MLLNEFFKNKKIIFAPIETTSRDTYWKARIFAENKTANILVIGRYEIINYLIYFSRKCIYIGKNLVQHLSLRSIQITKKGLKKCAQNNHKIIFIDEEGGLFTLKKKFKRKRFYKKTSCRNSSE